MREREMEGVNVWDAIARGRYDIQLTLTDRANGRAAHHPSAVLAAQQFIAGSQSRNAETLNAEQQRLWWIDRARGGDPALIVNFGFDIRGPFDGGLLETAAWRAVLEQPALWVRYPDTPQGPIREMIERLPPDLLRVIDLRGADPSEGAIAEAVREETRTPFDLQAGPLFRITVVRAAEERTILQIHLHHIAGDFRSLMMLARTITERYAVLRAGNDPAGDDPAAHDPAGDTLLGDHPLPGGSLPSGSGRVVGFAPRARPARPLPAAAQTVPTPDLRPLLENRAGASHGRTVHRAGAITRRVPDDLMAALDQARRTTRVTEGAIFFAALCCFLSSLTARESFAVAVPLDRSSPDSRHLVSFSATPLPLEGRVDLRDNFTTILAAAYRRLLSGLRLRHADFAAFRGVRSMSGTTDTFLPEILFSYSVFSPVQLSGGIRIADIMPLTRAFSDIELGWWFGRWSRDGACHVSFEYNAERFDHGAAEALLDAYFALLTAVLSSPEMPVAAVLADVPRPLPVEAWARRRIRLVSSFADDPLHQHVDRWAHRLGMAMGVEAAAYAQVLQDMLDPGSGTRANRDGATLVFLRMEDLVRARADRAALLADAARLEAALAPLVVEHAEAIAAAAAATRVPTILVFCPPSPGVAKDPALRQALARLEVTISATLADAGNVEVLSAMDATAGFGPFGWHDETADTLAHLPWSDTGWAALAAVAMRRLHEMLRRPVKAVVVDCDNTLWQGVVAEDGPHGVRITAGHRALQRRLVQAADDGIVLCLCSKNSEADVLAVFDQRADMALQRAHVVAHRINWRPKAENIAALAAELGLGLDSFVLLDDNPAEIAAVRAALPQVTAITVPAAPGTLARFAAHLWPLDRWQRTREDARRTAMYREEAARVSERRAAGSYGAFLAGLNLEITARAPAAEDAARIAQLTWRTNQFNAWPRPWNEADIHVALNDPRRTLRLIDVRDRFGDYGTVGLLAARAEGTTLVAEQFLMSCRVLGRGVEPRMINLFGEIAWETGAQHIDIPAIRTARNEPAWRFLQHLPADRHETGDATRFVVGIEQAVSFAITAVDAEHDVAAQRATQAAAAPTARLAPLLAPAVSGWIWEQVAGTLADTATLAATAAVKAAVKSVPAVGAPDRSAGMQDAEPVAGTRAALARLVASLPGGHDVPWHVPLTEAGLGSLDLVRLLAQIQRQFGVAIGFGQLTHDTSLADIAALLDGRAMPATDAPNRAAAREIVADLVLPRALVPPGPTHRRHGGPPRRILLTGATGFLGGYLATELLARGGATVTCLVRADSDADAAVRLHAALSAHGQTAAAASVGVRLEVLAGRLDAPDLGLGENRFGALAETTDAILHNAAQVDFLAPYSVLRHTNVLGTRHVLRLAAKGGGVPVHYVSSVAVFDTQEYAGEICVLEEEIPEHADGFVHAYAQTKWVAERNLRAARARGLPVTVYRPSNITGDSRTGHWPPGDMFTRMLRLSMLMGAVPDLDLAVDLTPVDFVAAAIACLVTDGQATGATLHLAAPRRTALRDMANWIRGRGVPLATVPLPDWVRRVETFAMTRPDDPAAALAVLLARPAANDRPSFLEFAARRPVFDTTRADQMLARHGLRCPDVGQEVFLRHLDHLRAARFLPSARPLVAAK